MRAGNQDLEALVERIAEAVVQRLEERRKIQGIADYVLAELERRQAASLEAPVVPEPEPGGVSTEANRRVGGRADGGH